MRLAFMGTPEFAVPTLDALVAAGHDVAAVYTQPPRPANRGKKLTPSAVQQRAEELGLPVRCPLSLRQAEAQADFTALGVDVAIVAAYGLILPPAVLEAPNHGCLNVHGSLLPRWRGAAPVQRAILAGDATTGVMVMQMEAGLDTGPVRATTEIEIGHKTTGVLTMELAEYWPIWKPFPASRNRMKALLMLPRSTRQKRSWIFPYPPKTSSAKSVRLTPHPAHGSHLKVRDIGCWPLTSSQPTARQTRL